MNKSEIGFGRISAILMMCVMMCCAHIANAKPVQNTQQFDHAKTGFLLKDVHNTLRCEQCHIDGIFKNTPKFCSGCHTLGTRVASKPKPINHVSTLSECDTCHVSISSFQVVSYKHTDVSGNCESCHNGKFLGVTGKTSSLTRSATGSATHIPTGLPCENCHTNTTSFLGVRMDHSRETECHTCHGGPQAGAATYPNVSAYNAATHVPLGSTPPSCSVCHDKNAGAFKPATSYKHSPESAGTCGTCHRGQYTSATPFPPNHFPQVPQTTGNACDSSGCHSGFVSFAGTRYDHTQTTAACATCHLDKNYAGVVSTTTATHFGGIPAAACNTCHTNFVTFEGAPFDHASTTAACSSCHSGQYKGIISINTATHIPSPPGSTCDTCHTNAKTGLPSSPTPTFLGVVFHQTTIGSGTTAPSGTTCGTCHSGTYLSQNVYGKGTTHVPTTADCVTCHTRTNTSSYTTFLNASYSHTGLPSGTCGTCHQGQYGSVVSINPAIHIPQTSGNACDVCHTNAITGLPASATPTFLNVVFHKTALGNPPSGRCSTCHSGGYLSENALAKDLGHVATTADCVTCHTASNTTGYTTFLGASFSHTPGAYAVFPSAAPATPTCSSCHNGATATGKVATHVTTTGDCNTSGCHTNATTGCPNCLTFYGVQYDHTNATRGVAAYTTFPAAGSTPNPRCDSCHGSTAYPKNSGHIPTTADCMTCHTPASTTCSNGGLCTTFLNAVYSHAGVVAGTCETCHQGQYPSVLSINPAVHIPLPSGSKCDSCHTNTITGLPNSLTPTFANVLFHKSPYGNPVINTGNCTSCHSGAYVSQNARAKNTGHVVTADDCGVCHTATNTTSYTTFLGASFSHLGTYAIFPTGEPATPKCSSCHGSTARGKNTGHISTSSDCISCHTNATTGCPNCSTFLGAAAAGPHTAGFMGGKSCVACHDGSQAVGLSANPSHIPIGSASCSACHPLYDGAGAIDFSRAAVGTLGGGNLGKYAMSHTAVSGTCTSCHSGAYVSQGPFGAVAKPTKHIPTAITGSLDCTTCHTTLTGAGIKVVSGAADWAPETMNHNGAQGGGVGGNGAYCVTCHLSSTSYLGKMDKKSHEGTSMTKDCSRSSCHKPLGGKGAAYTRWN